MPEQRWHRDAVPDSELTGVPLVAQPLEPVLAAAPLSLRCVVGGQGNTVADGATAVEDFVVSSPGVESAVESIREVVAKSPDQRPDESSIRGSEAAPKSC